MRIVARTAFTLIGVSLVAACASTDPVRDARREEQMLTSIEETHRYIDEYQLESVEFIRYPAPFHGVVLP